MRIDLNYIKTILIYLSIMLFLFSFVISIFKQLKHFDWNFLTSIFYKIQSFLRQNIKKNLFFRKEKHSKKSFEPPQSLPIQPPSSFDLFLKEIIPLKEKWLSQYTPFFRINKESHAIERFFWHAKKNEQLENFLIFWQEGYHPPSWTSLLVFYSAATNKTKWQQFLIKNIARESLPSSERLLLQFLFQDVFNDSILWQELYHKRAIIFNKTFRFNIELSFSERKWTTINFPLEPFDIEQPNQEEKFYKLFKFLQNDLEQKCNILIFRKLQEAYPDYDKQALNEIFQNGNYTNLRKISNPPQWTQYFLSPARFFSKGKITVEDFYHLRSQTNKIPFGDHHLLFLLYRIAPQSFLLQKISLKISNEWINKIENKEKNIPSPFIRFVEYLYALQTHQEELAKKMQVYLNTKTPKNIIFISRALAAGGRHIQAQRTIEIGLKMFAKDPLLLQEHLLYKNLASSH